MWRAFLAFACAVLLTAPSAAASNGMLAAVVDQRLITVNANGSGLRTLWAPGPGIGGLAWSPDGNRLALSYNGQLVVWDVGAGRGMAIGAGTDPTWSEGGIGARRGLSRVVVGADGRDLFSAPLDPLTTAFAWAPNLSDFAAVVGPLLIAPGVQLGVTGVRGAPAWSPGGDKLAFADGAGVHVVGGGLVAAGDAGPPRWSPDGGSLVYPAGSELRTVALGGSPRTVLAGGTFTAADWQPCGPATASCESVAPPRCSALAVSVTTQTDQAIDLPPEPCSDPAGRPLSLVIVKAPDHGTLDGRRYTPAPGFSGQDGVSYRVSNGFGESETVRVTIFVVPRPATLAAPPLVVVARAPFLSARATPRLDAKRSTLVRLSCDQDCRFAVRVTARLRSKRTVKGKLVRRSLTVGHVLGLRLRLPKKPAGRVKTAWIKGTVTSTTGRQRTVKLPVALPRRAS
jgi:hypothetical protein